MRLYVIMREYIGEDGEWIVEPVDIVSSLTIAESICTLQKNDGAVYFWVPVIPSRPLE